MISEERREQSCEVCDGCIFLNVITTKYGGDDVFLKPTSFRERANHCPRCGKRLSDFSQKIGGTD